MVYVRSILKLPAEHHTFDELEIRIIFNNSQLSDTTICMSSVLRNAAVNILCHTFKKILRTAFL